MYTPYTVMDAVQEKVEFIEIKSEFLEAHASLDPGLSVTH